MILADVCSRELLNILFLIRTALKWVCIIIPIIIIVMTVMDMAKIVTAGDKTDDLKKKAISQTATRIVFAIVIFLVPELVNLIFNIIPIDTSGSHLSGPKDYISCFKNTNV